MDAFCAVQAESSGSIPVVNILTSMPLYFGFHVTPCHARHFQKSLLTEFMSEFVMSLSDVEVKNTPTLNRFLICIASKYKKE